MKSVNKKDIRGIGVGLGIGVYTGIGAIWSDGFGVGLIVFWGILSLCIGFVALCGYLWNKSTINKMRPVWLKKVDMLMMFLFPLFILWEDNPIFATIILTYNMLRFEIYPYDLLRRKGAWKDPAILYPFLCCCFLIGGMPWKFIDF